MCRHGGDIIFVDGLAFGRLAEMALLTAWSRARHHPWAITRNTWSQEARIRCVTHLLMLWARFRFQFASGHSTCKCWRLGKEAGYRPWWSTPLFDGKTSTEAESNGPRVQCLQGGRGRISSFCSHPPGPRVRQRLTQLVLEIF